MLSSGLPPSKVEDETMDGEIPARAPWVQSKEMQNLAATNAALWSLLKLQHELSQQVAVALLTPEKPSSRHQAAC